MADLLLEKGYEVHGIVRRTSTPNFDRISHIRDRVTIHSADLSDQSSLSDVLKKVKPDEVYNFAAQSFVPTSWAQPVLTADSTALGVTRLLDAVRSTCPEARVYQASSSEMFGRVLETPQSERTPFYPRSPYGVAKVYGHHLVHVYRESYGLFAVSGICFNCEGPRRGTEFVTRKVTMAAARIKKAVNARTQTKFDVGVAPLKMGNLDARRDWGYAVDYVQAMWSTLQLPKADDFVIATGEHHSVRELLCEAFNCVGLNYRDWVETDESLVRPAEVDLLVGDPRKIFEATGWKATTKFPELVKLMVESDLK